MMRRTNTQRLFSICFAWSLVGLACGEKTADTQAGKPTDKEGKPKIQAMAPEFDFGKVKQGVDVEHTFKIKNAGTKDLLLDKARGS